MKNKNIILPLVLALSISEVYATDDANTLYKTYETLLNQGDLNGAYEALNKRSSKDRENLQYIYDEISFLMEYSNDKRTAIPLIEQALSIAEGKQDMYWLTRLNEMLAGALFIVGDAPAAYETGKKAISYYEGKDTDKEFADICQLMVGICTALEMHDEAILYGKNALDVRLKLFGENNELVASTLSALSVSYLKAEDLKNAINSIEKSEKIYSSLGIEEPSFYQNKASIAFAQNKFDEAQDLFSKAFDLCKNKEGNVDRQISILQSLSVCAEKQNKIDEALDYVDEQVNLAASYFGENHTTYASAIKEKALFEQHIGNYSKALDTFTKALNIYDKSLGQDSQQSHDILVSMYRCACEIVVNGNKDAMPKAKDFMSDKFFSLEVEGKDPVFLLAFAEWKFNCAVCIFDYIPTVINDNVDIVYSKDGKASKKMKSDKLGSFSVSIKRDKNHHDELLKLI